MVEKIVFILVVFLSNIIQCITGFAGTVLAMPVSIILVGYTTAKPILNILGVAASVGVVADNYKSVNKKEFFKIISIMLIGIFIGFYLTDYFINSQEFLYKVLGVIVIFFALINTFKFIKGESSQKELPNWISIILLIVSGLVHGMFVCGGPLLVSYASIKLKDTDEFRGTLSAVWIVLNSIIAFYDYRAGYFNSQNIILTVIGLATLLGAINIGNKIAKKISKKTFLVITYVLMLISGVSLLIK